jgi:hypothetical protein
MPKETGTTKSENHASTALRSSSLIRHSFDLIPDRIHLRKIDVAQFFAAHIQFVL